MLIRSDELIIRVKAAYYFMNQWRYKKRHREGNGKCH